MPPVLLEPVAEAVPPSVAELPRSKTGPNSWLARTVVDLVGGRRRRRQVVRERVDAGYRDHLVENRRQRHAVGVADRRVVGVVGAGQRWFRPCVPLVTPPLPPVLDAPPLPSGAPNSPEAAIGAIPSLRNL